MQFLTASEAETWCRSHGYSLTAAPSQPQPQPGGYAACNFALPNDAGRRIALARLLWETIAQTQAEVLLWTTASGIWPSGEHRALADAVCRGFGGHLPLEEVPAQLFRIGEDDAGLSFLVMSVLFLWDSWLMPANSAAALFLSHDEYGVAFARRGTDANGLCRRLTTFGIPQDTVSGFEPLAA